MQASAPESLAQAPSARERRSAARRDLAMVLAIAIGSALISVKLNLSELMLGWARPHERWQLDELPGVLLAIAISLIWFSTRRYAEARRELSLRRAAEARLAETLVENQRLAQRYLEGQEYERRSLARDLHDELGQYINAIKLDALALREAVATVPEVADRTAAAMIDNIDRVYAVVGGLIRQLRPVGLDELGLAAALEHFLNEWRQRLVSVRIVPVIESDLGPLDPLLSLTLFRLIQEGMTNVARHAQASRVEVRVAKVHLEDGRDGIEAAVADDGCGADLGAPRSGLGLIGMRERAAAFGGSLAISSAGAGAGFTVRAVFPLAPASVRDSRPSAWP